MAGEAGNDELRSQFESLLASVRDESDRRDRALEAAQATTATALESGRAVVTATSGALERLEALRDQLSSEAQSLRERLEAGPARSPGGAIAAAEPVVAPAPAEAEVAPPVAVPEAAADDPLRDVGDPLSHLAAQPQEAPAPATEETVAPAEPAADASARSPEEEARERVRGRPDSELVDNYEIGAAALGKAGDDEQANAYWLAFVEAIVAEAAARPDFGSEAESPDLGRRDRRKLQKRYGPLLEARAAAIEQG